MKPEYKIIAFYDRQCTNPVYIKKTFNRDFVKLEKFRKTKRFEDLDKHGCIGPIKFFIRKRPARTTTKKVEYVHCNDGDYEKRIFHRYVWEEVKLKEI